MDFELSRVRLYMDRKYDEFGPKERSEFLERLSCLLGLAPEDLKDVAFIRGCVLFEATIPTAAAQRLNELIEKARENELADDELKEVLDFLRQFQIKTDKFDYGPFKRINRPADRNLIVFVHGWSGSDTSFQGLVDRVKSRTNCEALVYDYPTGKITHSPPITFLARNLENAVRSHAPEGRSVGFIAHSMGGVVVRKLMVTQQRRDEPLDEITKLLVFAASPSQGVPMAGYASWVPFLKKDQLKDISPNSGFMVDLQDEWTHWRKMRKSIAIRAIYGTGDKLIAFESAAADDPEAVPVFGRNHRDIVKSDSDDDEVVKTLSHFIKKAGLAAS